ncbi:MAG: ATP-binding protein [Acetobacter sp.]|nr:ATP-binding protein [Acetobacter sp.]
MKTFTLQLKDEFNIFTQTEVTFSEGLTFLAGCNGAGKSTILSELQSYCEENKVHHVYLDASRTFNEYNLEHLPDWSASLVLSKQFRSEHEHYEDMFAEWVGKVRPPDKFRGKNFFVLIDGLDSGGDVINFNRHLELFKLMVDDALQRGIHFYLIVSCNNFFYLSYATKGNMLLVPHFISKPLPAYGVQCFTQYIDDMNTCYKVKKENERNNHN